MKFITTLWDKIKPQAIKELVAKEPVIATGVGGLAVSVATHYGLTLSASQQTWVSGGALILLNAIVRQFVSPVAKRSGRSKHAA